MACNKLWGYYIFVLNVIYSLVYLGLTLSDLYGIIHIDKRNYMLAMWPYAYAINVIVNIYLFLRLRKRDFFAFFVWYMTTLTMLVLRIRALFNEEQSLTGKVFMIVINVYIFLSIVIMLCILMSQLKGRRMKPTRSQMHPLTAVNVTDRTAPSAFNTNVPKTTPIVITSQTRNNYNRTNVDLANAIGFEHILSRNNIASRNGDDNARGSEGGGNVEGDAVAEGGCCVGFFDGGTDGDGCFDCGCDGGDCDWGDCDVGDCDVGDFDVGDFDVGDCDVGDGD